VHTRVCPDRPAPFPRNDPPGATDVQQAPVTFDATYREAYRPPTDPRRGSSTPAAGAPPDRGGSWPSEPAP